VTYLDLLTCHLM